MDIVGAEEVLTSRLPPMITILCRASPASNALQCLKDLTNTPPDPYCTSHLYIKIKRSNLLEPYTQASMQHRLPPSYSTASILYYKYSLMITKHLVHQGWTGLPYFSYHPVLKIHGRGGRKGKLHQLVLYPITPFLLMPKIWRLGVQAP